MTERPWLAHYDEGVPASLVPYPDTTLVDSLRAAARERPDHPALLFKGARMSFGELDRESDAFAAALCRLGVARGDRVALLLPNCPQFLIAEMGAWKRGAVVVPLNPIYNAVELEGPLRDTGAETVVVLTPFYRRVKTLQGRTAVRHVIATSVKEHLPPLLRLLFTLFRERPEGHRIRLDPGDHWFARLLEENAGAPALPSEARPGDAALVLMSGGTTGEPKGVVGLHRSLVMPALQVRAWWGALCEDWGEIVLLPLPLFHAYAAVGAQSFAIVTRATMALVPNPRDITDVVKTVRRVRPTIFVGVPTLFTAVLNHALVRGGRIPFRRLKLCLCGASALLAETRRRFEATTGARIVEAYSLSEALLAACAQPARGEAKAGSVGLPLPDVEVRIVDAEDGERDLPAGEVGEILLRAPQIMTGYWNNPGESRVALRRHDDGPPWLHTGDLGRMDGDGYVFVVDRKKDLIKPGGMQVWPREVEEAIALHPAVHEVGVAGVDDPVRGETVKAWVVLREGARADEAEIRAWCKERLAPYKVPARVAFRADLPKTMVGKVLRRALVAEERAAAASRV